MMKKSTKMLLVTLCMILALAMCGLVACGKKPAQGPAKSIYGFNSTLEISVDQQSVLTANTDGLEWTISDPTIAELTVRSNGKICQVKGLAVGTATITATKDGVPDTCALTVKAKALEETVTIKLNGQAVTELTKKEGDADFTLTAESSKNNPITAWESTDPSIATVTDAGVVHIVTLGKTKIRAKVTESIYADLALTVGAPEGHTGYVPELKKQSGITAADSGHFVYWSEAEAVGSTKSMEYIRVRDDKLIEFKDTGEYSNWHSLQLFKRDDSLNASHVYRLTFKIKLWDVAASVDAEGDGNYVPVEQDTPTVTILGNKYTLTAGTESDAEEKPIEIVYKPSQICFTFQLGYEDVTGVMNPTTRGYSHATGYIKDLTWTDINDQITDLQVPTSFSFSGSGVSDTIITINDANDAEKVGGYELGFFTNSGDAVPKARVTVVSGQPVDFSRVYPNGCDYTVKLRAIAKTLANNDSAWSAGQTLAVPAFELTRFSMEFGGSGDVKTRANLGKYMAWWNKDASWLNNGPAIPDNKVDAKMDASNTIFLTIHPVEGAVYNAVQIVYADETIYNYNNDTSGSVKAYTVTFDINSTVAGTISINDQNKAIVAGDNHISVNIAAGGCGQYDPIFSIAFGEKSGSLVAGTYVLSNFVFTPTAA